MLGTFQQSNLRLEVEASESSLRDCLTRPAMLQQWLWPQTFSPGMPERLVQGVEFTSWLGPIAIHHTVVIAEPNSLRLLLSQGVDGFHQWHWGDGWVQSQLEGVSLLPLNLAQTLSLTQLRLYLRRKAEPHVVAS